MIHLTMTPDVSSVRVYDEPGGYDARRPYLAIFKVTHLTDTTAYIHSAVGKIDRETRTKALDLLREKGIKTVMLERHGRIKTVMLERHGRIKTVEL